jgi:hypothetical protein
MELLDEDLQQVIGALSPTIPPRPKGTPDDPTERFQRQYIGGVC